ncbi:MAG: DUF2520 domain-containing protein [Pseudobdellovibrionaceae bacterium]
MKKMNFCQNTLLIGSGRLSTHLQFYCKDLQWNVIRSKSIKARNLKSNAPNLFVWHRQQTVAQLKLKLSQCDQVWLAIQDSALEAFIKKYLRSYSGDIIHFSGALEIPGSISVHPLMTFSHSLYPGDVYKKITWVHTSRIDWGWHFPFFKNRHRRIKPADKVFYHLLCVMSGNFLQILMNFTTDYFSRIGICKADLALYLQQSFQNQQASGWNGMTGPFSRKDTQTIEKHLNFISPAKNRIENRSLLTQKEKELFRQIYLNFQSLYAHRKAL